MLKNICLGTCTALGLLAGYNAAFMLVSPAEWYVTVPGVITTGPYNQHLIRDIGLIYLLVGILLLAGIAQRRHRVLLWLIPTLWLASHAFFHFWEVAVGICGPSALIRDLPAVTLPAIVGALLTAWAYCDAGVGSKRQPAM